MKIIFPTETGSLNSSTSRCRNKAHQASVAGSGIVAALSQTERLLLQSHLKCPRDGIVATIARPIWERSSKDSIAGTQGEASGGSNNRPSQVVAGRVSYLWNLV